MLEFDRATGTLILDGVGIGPGTRPTDLQGRLAGVLEDMAGQPGWQTFKTRALPLNVSVTFHDGLAHSGYFWANVPAAASWDELEPTEAKRRVEHEAIMHRLFGAERHEAAGVAVYLVRDPRDSMERIMFEFG